MRKRHHLRLQIGRGLARQTRGRPHGTDPADQFRPVTAPARRHRIRRRTQSIARGGWPVLARDERCHRRYIRPPQRLSHRVHDLVLAIPRAIRPQLRLQIIRPLPPDDRDRRILRHPRSTMTGPAGVKRGTDLLLCQPRQRRPNSKPNPECDASHAQTVPCLPNRFHNRSCALWINGAVIFLAVTRSPTTIRLQVNTGATLGPAPNPDPVCAAETSISALCEIGSNLSQSDRETGGSAALCPDPHLASAPVLRPHRPCLSTPVT